MYVNLYNWITNMSKWKNDIPGNIDIIERKAKYNSGYVRVPAEMC